VVSVSLIKLTLMRAFYYWYWYLNSL
jgi:hypothetical protein